LVLAGIVTIGLSACTTASNSPGGAAPAMLPNAPANIVISAADLQGKWGLASFRKPEDRVRTETEAKGACQNPYVVSAGTSGGVLMYLADQTEPSEVFVKTGPGGQVYIGPKGPPGVPQDRVVLSFENNVLVADWLNASARERYGTMVFVKCDVV
jgi:hypothetical protein